MLLVCQYQTIRFDIARFIRKNGLFRIKLSLLVRGATYVWNIDIKA